MSVDTAGPARVTVVMAAYNAERTIGAAISSVLQQDHPDVELVVVDDGSTDRTLAVCRGYGDLVTVLTGPNAGAAAARNRGVRAARGDLIAFCDADDQLLPAMVSRSVALLAASPERTIVTNDALLSTAVGIVPGRTLLRGKVPAPDRQRLTILQRNFVGIFSVFPRRLFDEVGGFDEELRQLEDWDLWLRAVFAGWRVVEQSRPSAIYRMSAGSLSTDAGRFDAGERLVARRAKELWHGVLTDEERRYLRRRGEGVSSQRLAALGADALAAGDIRQAKRHHRRILPLLVEDRRARLHALVVGFVPGAARAMRARHVAREAQLRRVGASSTSGADTVGTREPAC
ncbi:glycosyltransferase [Arthrobacter sp. NEB 688]|uniref:glycosyltransferase n=1 Tax=Arthrobacter sp. NEB 688 TaxID=904039 RepID=UPI001565876C|nr:glycosyltransferase [Arthrobacter sp. NEB 688]QKE85310.1 glycosyltransferase [Arthrobacter sp. NEB 688]